MEISYLNQGSLSLSIFIDYNVNLSITIFYLIYIIFNIRVQISQFELLSISYQFFINNDERNCHSVIYRETLIFY